jgi:hypothetical protein
MINMRFCLSLPETRVCEAKFFSSPLWYHLVTVSGGASAEQRCLEVFRADNVMLRQETLAVTSKSFSLANAQRITWQSQCSGRGHALVVRSFPPF